MIDHVQITAKAGSGGRGAVSFESRKFSPFGFPDGGDGGWGGNVYLKASKSVNTLNEYKFRKDFKASGGESGWKRNQKGKDGESLYLTVPLGTIVKFEGKVVADLDKEGQELLVAKGGKGGRGNTHLKPSQKEHNENRGDWDRWRRFEEGEKGEELELVLELKLLADIGLIGFPNAGKSTLLAALTRAQPKIASYPFTTLEPNLGVMEIRSGNNRAIASFVLADIPGLIEGAHSGRGLGVQFLRHIERTKLLIHVLSAESSFPHQDYETVNQELSSYSEKLKELPQIVILNKIDVLSKERVKEIKDIFSKKKVKIKLISAATGEGLEGIKKEILKVLSKKRA